MRDDGDFLKDLRSEIQATQERRLAFIRQKFLFVVGLLGIGTISFAGGVQTVWVLYVVPFVAFSFDLYIYGEDFGVKRAGAFMRKETTNVPKNEREWEKFVNKNRDPMTKIADAILSLLVLFAAALGLWTAGQQSLYFWVWIALNIVAILGLRLYRRHLAKLEKGFD